MSSRRERASEEEETKVAHIFAIMKSRKKSLSLSRSLIVKNETIAHASARLAFFCPHIYSRAFHIRVDYTG